MLKSQKLNNIDAKTLKKFQEGFQNKQVFEQDFWFTADQIEGEIPKDLEGTFIRNGPGLFEIYGTPLCHPIDGDGMVCTLTFKNGAACLKSKFIQTSSHIEEQKQKLFLYPGQMGSRDESPLILFTTGLFNLIIGNKPVIKFRNPSNTNAYYWGGKILTCYETQLPYQINPYTLETIEQDNLKGVLKNGTYSAHFKHDSQLNRLVTFSLKAGLKGVPQISFYEFDEQWQLMSEKSLKIEGLTYAHDLVVTPNYYIVQMSPFVKISSKLAAKVYLGLTTFGEAMRYYQDLPCKFVVIPRNTSDKKDYFFVDTDPCHIYHYGIAIESPTSIEFTAVALPKEFTMEFQYKIWLSNSADAPGKYYKYKIDLEEKSCQRVLIDEASVEFPTIHPNLHVLRDNQIARYSYLMGNDRGANLPYMDVIKHDLKGENRSTWNSEGAVGEPVFAPKINSQSEDDGYVIVQHLNINIMKTQFIVLDAKDLSKGPICRLTCNRILPYGFHGTFTNKVFLSQQPKL